jgi:hypothetical protein
MFGAVLYALAFAMERGSGVAAADREGVPPDTARSGVALAPAKSFDVKLDGVLDEWAEVPTLTLDSNSHLLTDPTRYGGDGDLSGTLRFVWDTLNLYVAGDFADDSLAAGAAWTSDRVNLVFDFHNDNHPLSYGGQAPDATRWQADDHWLYAHIIGDGEPPYPVMRLGADYHGPIEAAALQTQRTQRGWTFELSMPWSQLPEARAFIGAVCGLQIFVSDGDGRGRLTEIMWSDRWAYTEDAGLQWELWKMGKLVLTGQPLAPAPAAPSR